MKVEAVIYAQKYWGQKVTGASDVSKIYDITTLFFLNEIAGKLQPGAKSSADKVLDVLISDN